MQSCSRLWRAGSALALAAALGACATTQPGGSSVRSEPQWAANGWLNPAQSGEPEIIGLFVDRRDCEEAVAGWMSRQVVGNPVSGECLPIDRR